MPRESEIAIVLATRNGGGHLREQLGSYLAQTHGAWRLFAFDDGSEDDTHAQLAAFGAAHPNRLALLGQGPGRGAAANFLTGLAYVAAHAPQAAVAFSDQDDVWAPGKLARAASWLAAEPDDMPRAWVCRTYLTDADLQVTGESRAFPRGASFGNALVQNILAGNTLVLNPHAAQLVAHTVPAACTAHVPFHDWWIYQVITGAGGVVGFEPEPLVYYRQHGHNHLGHHGAIRGRAARLNMIVQRQYARWLDANLGALLHDMAWLTPEHRRMAKGFARVRARGGTLLARALPRLGLHRQTAQGDRSLRVMALAGRL